MRGRREADPSLGPPRFCPEDLSYLRSFARRLLEHITTHATSRVLLALDDMHHLGPAPELSEALAFAVGKATEQASIVIASREAPPGSWARFTADGRMARLGTDTLLMDADEVRRLLSAHPDWPYGSDDTVVTSLLAVTQGWASGVGALIELAKAGALGDEPLNWGRARSLVFENFAGQVVAALSPTEQRWLMLVAPCPVLRPHLLGDLVDAGVGRLLERLFLNNTLVSKEYPDNPASQPRYRLHALLRDFLRHKASAELSPRQRREFGRAMAQGLLALGEDDAARELLLETADWRALANHLEAVAGDLFAAGRLRTLTRFLEALPPTMREPSARLGYWRGLCLLHLDPAKSRRELTHAYARFRAVGDHASAIRAWAALVDAIWFEWEDCARLDACIDDLPYLRRVAKRLNSTEHTIALTKGAMAALSIRRPEHPEFGAWEVQNLALFQRQLPRSEIVRRGLQLMIHYVYGSGERRKAEIVRARLQQICGSETESAADHCVYHVVNAAYQFWFSPDGTQAPATVMTGLAVTQRLGVPFWDVPMLNAALFRLASDEDLGGMRNLLAILDGRLTANSREHDIAISQHFVAYLAWLEGDHEMALLGIEAACRIAVDSGFCISPVYYGVGHAAVLASLGRRRTALQRLSRARHAAQRQNSNTMQFMANMVGAAMALGAGRQAFARFYLRGLSKSGRTSASVPHPGCVWRTASGCAL